LIQNRGRHLLALLVLCAVSACAVGPDASRAGPTVDEARQFLAQAVALAQRGDFTGLCAIGDGNCKRSLDMAGRDAVPPAPPTVVGVRILPTTTTGDQVSIGGVVLELCGRDAAGKPYHSEMLVSRDGSGLWAINPVYWGNTTIAEGNSTAASPAPGPPC
jgi:hypothetical protein